MTSFEWDDDKDLFNQQKHGISFIDAQEVFFDKNRLIMDDLEHSDTEKRFFCIGQIKDRVMTVRFTIRHDKIRLIGAGYWRKGKALYDRQNKK